MGSNPTVNFSLWVCVTQYPVLDLIKKAEWIVFIEKYLFLHVHMHRALRFHIIIQYLNLGRALADSLKIHVSCRDKKGKLGT